MDYFSSKYGHRRILVDTVTDFLFKKGRKILYCVCKMTAEWVWGVGVESK